ncbi:MAG: hypothetical protein GEV10_24365 [Streptosporangiales bacterium]|nr:hypothetical protein [Streptosporangiales bacterium]
MVTDPHDGLPPGGFTLGDPQWEPWHPREVTDRLAGLRAPWCVVAGWAVDLFLGEQTRAHDDVEIAVPGTGFAEVRQALSGYEFDVVGAGRRWPPESPAFDLLHQTWLRDPSTGVYHLDVFREPHDGDTWICRRDETIRMPYARLVRHTGDGIPYLRPEVVLLFKAKWTRDKDEADFARVLPSLDTDAGDWLADALGRVDHDHGWLARISTSGRELPTRGSVVVEQVVAHPA